MEALYLNEYVSFEKLNQWLNALDLTKENASAVLEKALNEGFEDGSIAIHHSYVRRKDPSIKMTVEEKRVDDLHTMYRVSESYSSLIDMVMNEETMECVIFQSYGNYPSYVFMNDPEHAIIWEEFMKGR